jgi:hypothetical protein
VLPLQMLTHSDQFTPDIMIACARVAYDPPQFDTRMLITVTVNSTATAPTVSHRMQNWLDADGTMTQSTWGPTQVGSLRGGWWWRLDSSCVMRADWTMWVCPITPTRGGGSVYLAYDSVNQFTPVLGTSVCSNGAWATIPCPAVGTLSHLGYAGAPTMDLPLNAKLTGPTGGFGWVVGGGWTPPVTLNLTNIQVDPTDKLVLVLPYPRGSRFTITMFANTFYQSSAASAFYSSANCKKSNFMCSWNFSVTTSADLVRNGPGDLYFFDESTGHLYVRLSTSNGSSLELGVWDSAQGRRVWGIQPMVGWSRGGITLPARGANYLRITTDCGSAGRDATGAFCVASNGGREPASPCAPGVALPLAAFDSCGAGPGAGPTGSGTAGSASASLSLIAGGAAGGLLILTAIAVVVCRGSAAHARARKSVASSQKSPPLTTSNPVSNAGPSRWRRVVDADDGVAFFENDDGAVSWTLPPNAVLVGDDAADVAPAPPAFRRVVDDGVVFFENVVTGDSVWSLPAGARLVT